MARFFSKMKKSRDNSRLYVGFVLLNAACANVENDYKTSKLAPATPTVTGYYNCPSAVDICPPRDLGQNGTQTNTSVTTTPPAKFNNPPSLIVPAGQVILANGVLENLAVTISDQDGDLECSKALAVKASNSLLLPDSAFAVEGSTNSCKLKITPAANRVGTSWVTVQVSDGEKFEQKSFTVAVTGWEQEAYIKAGNSHKDASFGESVSLGDNLLAVSANFDNSNSSSIITSDRIPEQDLTLDKSGAVFLYRRKGSYWVQDAFIKAGNASANGQFGTSVSVSGNLLAVGASRDKSSSAVITTGLNLPSDSGALGSGSVHVFRWSTTGEGWLREAYIKASNAGAEDEFGSKVSLSGEYLAVSAPLEDSSQTTITNGTGAASADNNRESSGAVYVYKRSGTEDSPSWAQNAYIKAPNSDVADRFGSSVALHNETLVVGSLNEDANQTTITNTASSDNSASESGAVYVFKRSSSGWALEQYIKAPNAQQQHYFGQAVAVNGDRLAVSAPGESSNQQTVTPSPPASSASQKSKSGAVYLFKRSGSTWSLEAFIKVPNSAADYQIGNSLALGTTRLVIGAEHEKSQQSTVSNITPSTGMLQIPEITSPINGVGAAYVYQLNSETSAWAAQAYLKPSNRYFEGFFGRSVSLFNNTVAVGAPGDNSGVKTIITGSPTSLPSTAASSGAVYVYKQVSVSDVPELPAPTYPKLASTLTSTSTSTSSSTSTGTSTGTGTNTGTGTTTTLAALQQQYTNTYSSLIATNCTGCHGASSSFGKLTTFDEVKALSAKVKERLLWNDPATPNKKMPMSKPSFTEQNRTDLANFADALSKLP